MKGDFEPDAVREQYTSGLSEGVLEELRWGRLLSGLLYRSAKVRTFLFRQYGKQLTDAFADIITAKKSYASLCREHSGLKRFFRMLKAVGIGKGAGP